MPKTRPLGPPPDERPNWDNLNEGQRRYAWEQYNLAKVRRGIPIDHPIPGTSNAEPAQLNQEEQDYINEFDLSLLDNNTPQGNQEEASLDEILDRPVDPVDHQNIINELQNMSNGPEPIEIDQPSSSTGGNQGRGQKRRRTEGVGGTSLPGTAGGMGGGGMEQAVEPIPRPMYSAHTQIRHFKKVHRILTFGLAYKPIVHSAEEPVVADSRKRKTFDDQFENLCGDSDSYGNSTRSTGRMYSYTSLCRNGKADRKFGLEEEYKDFRLTVKLYDGETCKRSPDQYWQGKMKELDITVNENSLIMKKIESVFLEAQEALRKKGGSLKESPKRFKYY